MFLIFGRELTDDERLNRSDETAVSIGALLIELQSTVDVVFSHVETVVLKLDSKIGVKVKFG